METNIIEGNKLIAEFMGASIKRFVALDKLSVFWSDNNPNRPTYNGAGLENYVYHSSWDWIMPVVEKIESLNYPTVLTGKLNGFAFKIQNASLETVYITAETKIQAVWLSVIEFIKWYNQNK